MVVLFHLSSFRGGVSHHVEGSGERQKIVVPPATIISALEEQFIVGDKKSPHLAYTDLEVVPIKPIK